MNQLHQVIKQETDVGLEETAPPGFTRKCSSVANVGLQEKTVVVQRETGAGCSEEKRNEAEARIYEYPDPEFFDFEINKREECFAVGQLWAVYDDFDGMPRLYARIDKLYVCSGSRKASVPSFKVYITWLDASPDREDGFVWNKKGLPIACGKFESGSSGTLSDVTVFSHQVVLGKTNTCIIYPRKGQTWALFKNWSMNWSSDPKNNHRRSFDYEYVQVMSDYTEQSGIKVAFLVKIDGFVSLFKSYGMASFHIPARELLRFSHEVPCYETTGTERDGIPQGYFELDPASMPAKLVGASDSTVGAKTYGPAKKISGEPSKRKQPDANNTAAVGDARNGSWLTTKCSSMKKLREQKFEQSLMEIPETEFYYFDIEKSQDRIQAGQVWALYCELDGMPKYYGLITKVELSPEFKLKIRWLEFCTLPNGMLQWHDKRIPISAGVFASTCETAEFDNTASFSHLLVGAVPEKKNKYVITPTEGEVWAIYKKFRLQWSCDDLKSCQYDVCEVVEEKHDTIKVSVLEKVAGFETVLGVNAGSEVMLEVPHYQLIRFSHRIPAFRLTDERDGKLRGCWELDPKAMPVSLFHL